MTDLLLASNNAKKLAELQRILAPLVPGLRVLGLADVTAYDEPVEDGATFADNALLKARAGVARTGLPTIADDSGLCVDALNGMPGVLSARWSGSPLAVRAESDDRNNRLLLEQLHDVPDSRRGAHFACVIALCTPEGEELVQEGRMDGRVIREIPPKVQAKVKISKSDLAFLQTGLRYVATEPHGTMNWRLQGFPHDRVELHCKTGSAEVYGKQTTSWVACFDANYVTVMMISQAGTGSGASGPGVRAIWESLYGVEGEDVVKRDAAIPGTTPPATLPVFAKDGSILPPAVKEDAR